MWSTTSRLVTVEVGSVFYMLDESGQEQTLLTLLLTLCGLTGRKLPRGGPGLSGLVHEEAHPSISYHT